MFTRKITVKTRTDKLTVRTQVMNCTGITFHGESVKELTQSLHDCIDNYLDYCQKIGKDPEREFKGSFNVRIKPEQHKKIALYAANEGITINQFVSRAIDDELDILEG